MENTQKTKPNVLHKGMIDNMLLVLENDSELKDCLAFNELNQKRWIINALPWNEKGGREFKSADSSQLLRYVQNTYPSFKVHGNDFREAVNIIFSKHPYNPIKEWFNSLKWDGVERVDNFLSDVFGLEKDGYGETVMRKFFLAAVRRIFSPGCKWDYMPVFIGRQGIGKSKAISRLCADAEWFSDTLEISNDNKKNVEQMQGKWIFEMAELAGMKRADLTKVKSFITTSHDNVRLSYRSDSETFYRHCVFIGTTNEDTPLKDNTGNRRFLPIDLGIKAGEEHASALRVDRVMTQKYVQMLWAEAFVLAQSDEKLFFEDSFQEKALQMQQTHTEVDEWQHVIFPYLDKLKRRPGLKYFTALDVYCGCIVSGNTLDRLDRRITRRINDIIRKRDDVSYRIVRDSVTNKTCSGYIFVNQ